MFQVGSFSSLLFSIWSKYSSLLRPSGLCFWIKISFQQKYFSCYFWPHPCPLPQFQIPPFPIPTPNSPNPTTTEGEWVKGMLMSLICKVPSNHISTKEARAVEMRSHFKNLLFHCNLIFLKFLPAILSYLCALDISPQGSLLLYGKCQCLQHSVASLNHCNQTEMFIWPLTFMAHIHTGGS